MNLDIITLLSEGDKRTVNNVSQVVRLALKDRRVIKTLIDYITNGHEALAMRAADALQKVHAQQPLLLHPYAPQLINLLQVTTQKEVRWHLAQILPHLPLTRSQTALAAKIWQNDFYHSKSSIVKTFSLQAMHDIAVSNTKFKPEYQAMLAYALSNGTPAMKSRARLLQRVSP